MLSRRPGERFNRGRIAPPGGGGLTFSGLTDIQTPWVWDNSDATAVGSGADLYYRRDPHARVVITTSDTSLTVKAVGGGGIAGTGIDIRVNGLYNQTLTAWGTPGASATAVATLPGGAKTVEIVEGQAHLQAVGSASFTVILPTTPAVNRVFVGASNMYGAATSPQNFSWPLLVRNGGLAGAVLVYAFSGYSSESFKGGDNFDTAVAELGLRRNGVTNSFWFEVGSADFQSSSITPAAYAANMVTWFTKLHAAYPSDAIYFQSALVIIAPWSPNDSAPNSQGFTHQDYRDAVMTALSGSCPYVIRSAGEMVQGLTYASDGGHLNNAGNAVLAAHNINVMQGAIGGFLPSSITGNKLWVRADRGQARYDSEVAAMADLSGLLGAVFQTTAAKQPTFNANDSAFNGRPSWTIVRANSDHIISDTIGTIISGTGMPYEVWIVAKWVSAAQTRTLFSWGNSGTATPFLDGRIDTTGHIVCVKTTDAAVSTTKTTTQVPTAGVAHVLRFSSDGLLLSIDIDGTPSSVVASAEAVGAMTVNRFTLWALRRNGAETNLFDGFGAETIVFNGQLSSGDATALHAALKALYNTP